jgi:hypothetical protein
VPNQGARAVVSLKFIKPERICLSNHSEYHEKWVQERIAEDPSILGAGDLVLKDKERSQPRAGRLVLLLQDADLTTRYEAEVMLGSTPKSPYPNIAACSESKILG